LEPFDLSQFRAIAKGATPLSAETCPHFFHDQEARIFGVLAYDDSMAGAGLEKGAVVLVNPDASYEAGDTVAVIVPERGRIQIRKYRGMHIDVGGRQYIYLAAFRYGLPTISSYPYEQDAAQIIGRVCWVARSF
jgi:SOS-response transcriptional repressor LexA